MHGAKMCVLLLDVMRRWGGCVQNMPALTPRQLAVLRRRPPAVPLAEDAGTTVVVESEVRDRVRRL